VNLGQDFIPPFNQDIFFHQVIQAVIQSFLKVKKFEFLPLVIGTHFHESRLETSSFFILAWCWRLAKPSMPWIPARNFSYKSGA
jgi:hypothetical protein